MNKKTLLNFWLLLLCMISGVGTAWAEEETIASFTIASHEGWTITNAESATAGGGYYKLISSDASIVSPSINWTNYSDITITISARTFGGPDATQGKISVSQGGTELASYSPSGKTIAASSALEIFPVDGSITISCPGASSGKGCGVQSIVIKGTKNTVPVGPNLEENNLALTSAPIALNFDLYNNSDAQGIRYTTSCTGTVSIDKSDYATFEIDAENKTITVTPKAVTPSAQTITVNQAADETYKAGSATFTLTITDSTPIPTYTFTKVTDASSLREGDKLIIVNEAEGKAMGEEKTNNFGASDLTITDGVADGVASNTVSILTLEGTTGAWYFKLNGNYLYAASSSSNQLKTEAKKDDNAKATIEIAEGDATILFKGTNTRNNLRYNSSSTLFSCYSSGQNAVQLYRMSELVTLPAAIYATRCYEHALDFSRTGIKAYTVKVNTEQSTARVTEIAGGKVPAGEGVILYAETAGTYAVPVIESAAALDNDLVGVTEDTAVPWRTGDKYNYILQHSESGYAFNKATGAMLAANRAYLQTTYKATAAGARLALVFDDDTTTGISDASRVDKEGKGSGFEIYNLKGQRVENPVKGQLYIVNGKKVVMK